MPTIEINTWWQDLMLTTAEEIRNSKIEREAYSYKLKSTPTQYDPVFTFVKPDKHGYHSDDQILEVSVADVLQLLMKPKKDNLSDLKDEDV